jgi:hypothetical protein
MAEQEDKKRCLPCEVNAGERRNGDCIAIQDYLSVEEEDVLSRLRELKEEFHKTKDKIRGLEETLKSGSYQQPGSPFHRDPEGLRGELQVCFEQLERLRRVWKEQEALWEEANRRKMVLLGHSPGV